MRCVWPLNGLSVMCILECYVNDMWYWFTCVSDIDITRITSGVKMTYSCLDVNGYVLDWVSIRHVIA